jgi:4'-phosphopantetheinyl transferase
MSEISEWTEGPASATLEDRVVHVWLAPLDIGNHERISLRDALSADELDRAARFHFEEHRNRFIAGRGVLRDILARYIHVQPREIAFDYNSFGKPELANQVAGKRIYFNLSHSGGLALFAVARDMEVGIDLEQIQPERASVGIAERFFSAGEVAALQALPARLQSEGFFSCWTRKEAYIKAIGEGLQIPLDSFEVSVVPGQDAAILKADNEKWSLHSLRSAPGYAAALVAEAHDCQLQCFRWTALQSAATQ